MATWYAICISRAAARTCLTSPAYGLCKKGGEGMALAYVCLYLSYRESLEPYTMEERGRLVTAMMDYQATGVIPIFPGNERYLWPTLQSQLDRDIRAYEEKCAKNQENGAKGGRPRKQTVSAETEGFYEKTKKAKEKEKENEMEKKMENATPSESEDKSSQRSRFSPPPYEAVVAYCSERGGKVDPQRWYDFYLSNGWKVGKNPMRDWKAAVRSWERNSIGAKSRGPNGIELADNEDHTLDGIL